MAVGAFASRPSAVAGALAVSAFALMSQHPIGIPTAAAPAIRLLSSPLQAAIDQLLDAERQVTATVSGYPFISAGQLPAADVYTQNLFATTLAIGLGQVNARFDNLAIPTLPFATNAPATDPQPFFIFPNPDDQYHYLPIDSGKDYLITVRPGPGSQDVTFTEYSGNGSSALGTPLKVFDLADATPNPDGTYTIALSSAPQSGNWLDTSGGSTVLIRDTVDQWGLLHDSMTIQQQGGSAFTLPLLSHDQIATLLSTVAATAVTVNSGSTYFGQMSAGAELAPNTFSPFLVTSQTIPGVTLPTQVISSGAFSLEPGQALIVKVPEVDAGYSGLEYTNDYGQNQPYVTAQGSLNNAQSFHDSDGFTYYVISGQDPGVANWIDSSGLEHGRILMRWQDVVGAPPNTPISTQVVDVGDVRNELPSDTPLVSPVERAAELHDRLFEYGYLQDQDKGPDWVLTNLIHDQIRAAVGADQYGQAFGGQLDVPSVLDRLTSPALRPDLGSVASALAADPEGGLAALVANLPLIARDLQMPMVLAELRLELLVAQTLQAVQGDIASHQYGQVLTELGTGFHELGRIIDQTLTDPGTGVFAGILNARDDLSVALLHAGDYPALSSGDFTAVADQLSQLDHESSQLLDGLANLLALAH